jgi:hypothetical protein
MVLNSILDETREDGDSVVSLLGEPIIHHTQVLGTGNPFD